MGYAQADRLSRTGDRTLALAAAGRRRAPSAGTSRSTPTSWTRALTGGAPWPGGDRFGPAAAFLVAAPPVTLSDITRSWRSASRKGDHGDGASDLADRHSVRDRTTRPRHRGPVDVPPVMGCPRRRRTQRRRRLHHRGGRGALGRAAGLR